MRALHTPGHRPEHTAFALIDTAPRPGPPWAVLTGDTLFVGDIARPDLAVESPRTARAAIFRSLHERLLDAPRRHVEVWPGHLGGSLCGGPGMDLKVVLDDRLRARAQPGPRRARRGPVRRGRARRARPAAAELPGDRRASTAARCGPARCDAPPLTPRQLVGAPGGARPRRRRPHRAAVRRRARARRGLHHRAARAASAPTGVARRPRPAGRLRRPRRRRRARRAPSSPRRSAITNVAGRLAGGMTSWREERRAVARVERIDGARAARALGARPRSVQILDVRERSRVGRGPHPGSLHVPYHDLNALPGGLDPARPVAAICASGQRSAVAASLLQRDGAARRHPRRRRRRRDVGGAGWPIER